jgi:hypothetical protein
MKIHSNGKCDFNDVCSIVLASLYIDPLCLRVENPQFLNGERGGPGGGVLRCVQIKITQNILKTYVIKISRVTRSAIFMISKSLSIRCDGK